MKVETFKIDNWEKNQTGLVVAEDKNWVLVRHIPSDLSFKMIFRQSSSTAPFAKSKRTNCRLILSIQMGK